MADRLLFPPTTAKDIRARGWDAPDFVYVSGDAYVDHPSFGAAVICRTLEAAGYRVAVLAQPNWKNCEDFKRFGRPNYGFLVSSGVIDSMVNHYTAAKKRRSSDVYTPGGKAARRPDRALTVYCRLIREAYGDIPVAVGKGPTVKIKDMSVICSPKMVTFMQVTAEENGIPYQNEIILGGGTDTAGIMHTGKGAQAGCMSIPCRNIHSPCELVSIRDMENGAKLIAACAMATL